MKRDMQSIQDVAIKILAVVGLLALFALGSFATISMARYAGVAFSYLASAAVSLSSVFVPLESQNLIVTLDPINVASGKTVTLSWKQSGNNKGGSYSLSYLCLEGFYFEVTTKARGKEIVFCNIPFPFVNTDNTLALTPFSTKNQYVDMPVTLSFTLNGESEVTEKETVTISVARDGARVPTSTHTSTNIGKTITNPPKTSPAPGAKTNNVYIIPTTGGSVTENPNGKADLKVSIIEVGIVDKTTNLFVKSDALRRNDRVGVRFAIENIGTKSTGEWRFNGILPTFPSHTFNSDSQQSLRPGDRIEFTIGFDQILAGSQNVRFVIDPQGFVTEISEDNNSATVNINVF